MESGAQRRSPVLPPQGHSRASCPKAVKAEEAAVGRTTDQRRSRQDRGTDKGRENRSSDLGGDIGGVCGTWYSGSQELPRQEGGAGAGKQRLS